MKITIDKKCKFSGFSLAEALITLLVVCLITLASIPILTKKRRNLKDGTHGRWVCTQHSLGHLVHWQKGLSVANEDDPESWDAGCKFVPPHGARNFAITVIGSGGGGASGISEIKEVASTKNGNTSFMPESDGEYFVVAIGGGGGGAQGLYYDASGCNSAAGGAGSSGSVFAGRVKLYKGKTYILERGNGGTRNTGSGWNGCVRDTDRAGSGGASKLYTEGSNDLVITAWGGQGGVNIKTGGYSTWCKRKCRGGEGGGSPKLPLVVINNTNKTSQFQTDGESVVERGEAGENGGCNRSHNSLKNVTYSTGGKGFSLFKLGVNSGNSYGAGGNGSLGNRYMNNGSWIVTHNYLDKLSDGQVGYVGVYQIIRKQGQGGEQSEPEQVMVPSIEGNVKITLGESVDADTDGQETRVEIFNKFGTRSRLIRGFGGKKGTAIVSETNTDGAKSIWTDDGGGLKGDVCKKGESTPIYESEASDISDKKLVCVKLSCSIDPDNEPNVAGFLPGDPNKAAEYSTGYNQWINLSYNKSSLEKVFKAIGMGYFKHFYPDSAGTGVNYSTFSNMNNYFIFSDKLIKSYDNYNQNITSQGQTYYRLDLGHYCFRDSRLNYVPDCDEEKSVSTGESSKRIIGYRTSYDCPDASNALRKAYGAGGGGGYAPDVLNFAGKGGKSAPGAVIIEW